MFESKSQTLSEAHKQVSMLFREIAQLNFVDSRGNSRMTYEGRKAGIEKRFSEILSSVRVCLEQLRAYIIKSNSELDRRLRDQKGSLTRQSKSGQDKSIMIKRMEDDS